MHLLPLPPGGEGQAGERAEGEEAVSTDRELLELAAKAVGYDTSHPWNAARLKMSPPVDALVVDVSTAWNPLADDGDALRLAVNLRLVVHVWDDESTVSVAKTLPNGYDPENTSDEWHSADSHEFGGTEAAARRAIVSVAAEIGRNMP